MLPDLVTVRVAVVPAGPAGSTTDAEVDNGPDVVTEYVVAAAADEVRVTVSDADDAAVRSACPT
jgi:hypothetical protein